jgi:UDP-2,3-diacylglucosamine hydrolase
VSNTRVVVVADAHLGQVPATTESALHRFLDAVPDLGDALLINGDLFDFWFEWSHVIPHRHFVTLTRLAALRARGIPITFMGGNHDRWGGGFLGRDLGIEFHPGEAELDLAGHRSFVAHGDGLTEQRWSARLLHHVTRHRITNAAFRALHPTVGFWVADKLSGPLGDHTRDRAVLDRAEAAQAAYAGGMLAQRPELGLVVLAHTHRARLDVRPDRRAYLNPGAFLDGGRYALVTEDGVTLERWTG